MVVFFLVVLPGLLTDEDDRRRNGTRVTLVRDFFGRDIATSFVMRDVFAADTSGSAGSQRTGYAYVGIDELIGEGKAQNPMGFDLQFAEETDYTSS